MQLLLQVLQGSSLWIGICMHMQEHHIISISRSEYVRPRSTKWICMDLQGPVWDPIKKQPFFHLFLFARKCLAVQGHACKQFIRAELDQIGLNWIELECIEIMLRIVKNRPSRCHWRGRLRNFPHLLWLHHPNVHSPRGRHCPSF